MGSNNGLTQTGKSFSATEVNQNGLQFGTFTGITIDQHGIVTANFDNGLKQPIYIANILSGQPQVHQGARRVAAQMDERVDGSGFPKQQRAPQIHPLAKVAKDVTAGMVLIAAVASIAVGLFILGTGMWAKVHG